MDLDHANFFTARIQVFGSPAGGFGAGAHHYDHPLGVGRADVIEQVILAADQPGKLVHSFLNDIRAGGIVRVDRLTALEVNVGVLGRAAQHRAIGRKPPAAVRPHQVVIDHGVQVIFGNPLNLVDFV